MGHPANSSGLLLQLGELRLGFLQNGDVGVGVFPESEEVLIRLERGGVVAHHGLGPAELQTGKRSLVVQLQIGRASCRERVCMLV